MKKLLSVMKRPAIQPWKNSLKAELIRTLRVHALFMALVLSYAGALLVAARIYHAADKASLSLYSMTLFQMTGLFILVFIVVRAIHVMLFLRPERPLRYYVDNMRAKYLTRERFFNGLPVFLFMPVFMSAFTSFKTMIPIINPFSWDATFARWDAVVHGGTQPWQLLHPVIGHPLLTTAINFFYNLWFFVMFMILFWQTFSLRDARLRMQFFLTFILSWVLLGTVGAIVFSSAGPCFYDRVVAGEDIFQPLVAYLSAAQQSVPVWALNAQEMLWDAYANSKVGRVNGISAMPSMHMSMAFLFALVGWRTHRAPGVALTVFAVLIMIGCVHLGWHYAIDGYAAIVCTWPIWWAVGRLLSRPDAHTDV
ncbi:MAG: phosphatase PAP2 family protein [Planctomycetota bacterium]|nr:MAG: phosphatase PAP2 family protein [Planctomycetota bacterium]